MISSWTAGVTYKLAFPFCYVCLIHGTCEHVSWTLKDDPKVSTELSGVGRREILKRYEHFRDECSTLDLWKRAV